MSTSTIDATTVAFARAVRLSTAGFGTLTFSTAVMPAAVAIGASCGMESPAAKQAHRALGYLSPANDAWAPAPREPLTT